jgi:excisionase family DNA binding protein
MPRDKQLTLQEVASRLRVSDDTIYRLLKNGGMSGFKVGLQWRINESEIARFMYDMSNKQNHSAGSAHSQKTAAI